MYGLNEAKEKGREESKTPDVDKKVDKDYMGFIQAQRMAG